jgi:hypothetical protein
MVRLETLVPPTNGSIRFSMNWHKQWNRSWLGNCVKMASLCGKTNGLGPEFLTVS